MEDLIHLTVEGLQGFAADEGLPFICVAVLTTSLPSAEVL